MPLRITCVCQSELCIIVHADETLLSLGEGGTKWTFYQTKKQKIGKYYIFVGGSRVDPKVGDSTWDYMMEQVKPQHSFSRVRPVLVRGEEVCWALDRGRLAGTPQTQAKEMLKDLLHN